MTHKKKVKHSMITSVVVGAWLALLLLAFFSTGAPPVPHGIAGTIYHSDSSTQVPLGTYFSVNDTTSKDYVKDITSVPVPGFTGRYSVSINGIDGDPIIIRAWNNSNYGQRNVTLISDMNGMDIIFNRTRPPEPNITIIYPPDNSKFNASLAINATANITFFGGAGTLCNATISFSDQTIINVSYPEKETINIGSVSRGTSLLLTWNLTTGLVGTTNLSITASCLESGMFLEANGIDKTFNLSVSDTIPPNITLISPSNNTITSNVTQAFRFFVNDTGVGTQNCSLLINNSIVSTNSSINEKQNQTILYRLFVGSYNWEVQCYDIEGNYKKTARSNIYILAPDLQVNESLLRIPNSPYQENRNITINVTIWNLGNINATNAVIQMVAEQNSLEVPLRENVSVNITAGKSITLFANYTTEVGVTSIIVRADPPLATNGSIIESNESNNYANQTITIPIWQISYGNVFYDILLGMNETLAIYNWLNSTQLSGNIYITDTESSVSWSKLAALSRDTSLSLQMDDFQELDIALNYSTYDDSVNNTFTSNGVIINEQSFYVFDKLINNVPVTNSTNSSSFVSGILWDTSDGGSEYDGNQDIVFITNIRESLTVGKYGTYNYEVRVPANLKKYVNPSIENEIAFYVELL